MFGLKKSPMKLAKHSSVQPGYPVSSCSNPFDSDDELDVKKKVNPTRTSSAPVLSTPNFGSNPFDDDADKEKGLPSSSSSYSLSYSARNKYKNDFRDTGGIENQSVQELEKYAVYKAEQNTKSVYNCLKIAEDIREDATKTLVTLHHQGEQITRTHTAAADIDYDLSRGEKLLGSLGGIFCKTWKPKKTRPISGPVVTRDDSSAQRFGQLEQREKLGLASGSGHKGWSSTPTLSEPASVLQKVEVEKGKQDDALSDLSNLLGELKDMAVDMGSEIGRQNKALDHMHEDVDELNYRVRGANRRGRHLLGK